MALAVGSMRATARARAMARATLASGWDSSLRILALASLMAHSLN